MATIFFSYSHSDESLRDELEVHLAGLKRQGLISAWHDRKITAGSEFGNSISENLEAALVILLLVSPDFINSDYCYELEMKRAMERHDRKEARVVPVILRPCDWHDLPFGKLLGVPKDGKPITTWPNRDEAFLDVVRAIKSALKELHAIVTTPKPAAAAPPWKELLAGPRSSNLRIRKEFTDLDLDRFLHEGFDFIAKFFENSMRELVNRNPGLDQRFQRIDANHFTAAVYRNGSKVCKGSASAAGGVMGRDSISYTMNDQVNDGGMNEVVSAKADDQSIYFEALGMQSYGSREKEKLTHQGAAELFWELFIRPLQ